MSENNEVREALNRVKQYMTDKDYERARAELMQINHPKRDEWLARIDSLTNQQALEAEQPPRPWDPYWISNMSIVMTPILSGLLLAWNWRRFGKKAWALPTALIQIGFFVAALLFGLGALPKISMAAMGNVQSALVFSPLMLLFVLNYLFPFFIGRQQGAAYQLLDKKGYQAMNAYHYNWDFRALMYLGLSILIAAGMTAFGIYTNQPKTFEDEQITLTHPAAWTEQDMGNLPQCSQSNVICHIYLVERGFYPTELHLQTVQVEEAILDAQTLGNFMWGTVLGQEPYQRIEHGAYQLIGLDAHYFHYTHTANGYYFTDFLVPLNNAYLYISIASPSEEAQDEDWEAIEGILNSLVIKSLTD